MSSGYNYYKNLEDHVGKNYQYFKDEFKLPRQLEIHLPSNHNRHCQLNCMWCQGLNYNRLLSRWEQIGLNLLYTLSGQIPYHIYGGAYTEPLMNPYLTAYLSTTKYFGNHFGIHTNGLLLKNLEDNFGFITELNNIATDKEDYLSISLDGGIAYHWSKAKRAKPIWFDDIILGLKKAATLNRTHSIRICYLVSTYTCTKEDFKFVVDFVKEYNIDSLRFTIPYAIYNQDFSNLEKYKQEIELPMHKKVYELVEPHLSDRIFYVNPSTVSVDQFYFKKCIYPYYQITLGADGYMYRCSSVAAPDAMNHRLGKITDNYSDFTSAIKYSYNENWDCQKECFSRGLRCNRMSIECNQEYDRKCND